MKTTLIMLPNPILVSNEEIPEESYYISTENKILKFTGRKVLGDKLPKECKKIIAGIEGLPKLDLSDIADEIGWVDVEKWAITKFGDGDYAAEAKMGFKYGFKAAQSLNEKKYSEEDVRNAISFGVNSHYTLLTFNGVEVESEKFIKSISKPKEYDVEVDMEEYGTVAKDFKDVNFRPKITNNTIKVTKIV